MQDVKIPSGSMFTYAKPSKINTVALSAPTKPNIKSFRTGCCEGAADGENETLRALVPMRAYQITFGSASHESLPVTRDCGSPSATLLLFSVLFQAFFPLRLVMVNQSRQVENYHLDFYDEEVAPK